MHRLAPSPRREVAGSNVLAAPFSVTPGEFRSFISPELTRKVVPKNSHGSEMLYDVDAAIATYEMIFA
jgi:hypothetical protein